VAECNVISYNEKVGRTVKISDENPRTRIIATDVPFS
jgi:hypothetical protein